MRATDRHSWIEVLTEIVLHVEGLEEENRENIRMLTVEFFHQAVDICQSIRGMHGSDLTDDEEAFIENLLQSGHNLNANLANLDRSSGNIKDEICYEMYRFISLLSQRINFGTRD